MYTTRPLTRLGFAALACAPLSVALGEGSELPDGSVTIDALPFVGTGDTSDNLDDYDALCPWASTSPDVFYTYTQTSGTIGLRITTCAASYDTKLFVLDQAFNVIACDDDNCSSLGAFRSLLPCLLVNEGETIHIAVDGWSGDAGVYELRVESCPPPIECIFESPRRPSCPPGAISENEACDDDFNDTVNGGCDSTPAPLFTTIACGDTVCGQVNRSEVARDTDWFELNVPIDADVVMTVVGECRIDFGRVEDSACIPGAPNCQCISGTIDPFLVTQPCDEAAITSRAPSGISWWFVTVGDLNAIPCGSETPGNDYIVSWNCTLTGCCALGDANDDGAIDFADLIILLANWGPCSD